MESSIFLGHAIHKMIEDGIDVHLMPVSEFEGCAGEFSFEEKTFKLATDRSDWFEVFIHEYCHYLQNKDNYNYGLSEELFNLLESEDDVKFKQAVTDAMFCELDCERRVIDLAINLNLQIDISFYIKKANAYVLSYHLFGEFKKWTAPGKPCYSNDKILNMISGDRVFSNEEAAVLPDWFKEIALAECYV